MVSYRVRCYGLPWQHSRFTYGRRPTRTPGGSLRSTSTVGAPPTPASYRQTTWPGSTTANGRSAGTASLRIGGRSPSSPRIRTAASSGSLPGDRSGAAPPRRAAPRRVRTIRRSNPADRTRTPLRSTRPSSTRFTSTSPISGKAWDGGWSRRSARGSSPGGGTRCSPGSLRTIRPGASTRRWAARKVRVETITIGGTELTEVAYGWSDISPLTTGA